MERLLQPQWMMIINNNIPGALFLLAIVLASATAADAKVKSVIVFGDSQFDPGNNQYIKNCTLQANFRPYGSSFFHHPTGRFTNGRTVADFIAQFLGIKFQRPFEEVYRQLANGKQKGFPTEGINFASAGSGLLRETNNHAAVTPIQVQLKHFQTLIDHKHLPKHQIAKSLIFLESGGNDIFSYFLLPGASKMTPGEYIHAMLKEVALFVDKIYKNGGRRIVIFSVGPLGCIPGRVLIQGASTDRCLDAMDNMVKFFNAGLKRLVITIPRKYPGAIAVYGVVYDTVQNFRDYPKRYGFANVTDACCGGGPLNGMLQCGLKGYKLCPTPNKFFFWDYFHPTERTYGLLSKALWAGGKRQIWPINLKTLSTNITLLP